MKQFHILSLFFFLFFGFACSNSLDEGGCELKKPINPNGDSELALLMRDMADDADRMREQIKKGEKPEVLKRFETIHSAVATEPGKVKNEEFKTFANAYLTSIKSLQKATAEESKLYFNGLVETCMNCHTAFCPGPKMRIKKLYLK